MRCVAGHALALNDGGMREGLFGRFGHGLVAGEAECRLGGMQGRRCRVGGGHVAGGARRICDGLVRVGLQHPTVIRPVRIVAGDAEFGRDGVSLVLGQQVLHVMAGDAQFFRRAHQSFGQSSGMGLVATQTFTSGRRSVRVRGAHGLCDGHVAAQAQFKGFGTQESLRRGIVRSMALAAILLEVGFVGPAVLRSLRSFMAGDASAARGEIKEMFLRRGMGPVACGAFAGGEGGVFRSFGRRFHLAMAGEAEIRCFLVELNASFGRRRRMAGGAAFEEWRMCPLMNQGFSGGGVGIMACGAGRL